MPPLPSGSASAISFPRRLTSSRVDSGDRDPAAAKALYSPRLWPAAQAGDSFPESACHSVTLTTVNAGWRCLVSAMSAASSLSQ